MGDLDCFNTSVLTPSIIRLDEVTSTNDRARELMEDGCPEGTIVLANAQTAGRGRSGRMWLSPLGGLYFTILLKPRLGREKASLLGLLAACAVASGLRQIGVSEAKVKWPNDILVGGKKISGILAETVTKGETTPCVLMGIGVNQNSSTAVISQYLEWPVTSVLDELGRVTQIDLLLCLIVNGVDRLLSQVESSSSFDSVLDEWRELSCTLGEKVRVEENGEVVEGIARDIGDDGALILETAQGVIRVVSGDVAHLAR